MQNDVRYTVCRIQCHIITSYTISYTISHTISHTILYLYLCFSQIVCCFQGRLPHSLSWLLTYNIRLGGNHWQIIIIQCNLWDKAPDGAAADSWIILSQCSELRLCAPVDTAGRTLIFRYSSQPGFALWGWARVMAPANSLRDAAVHYEVLGPEPDWIFYRYSKQVICSYIYLWFHTEDMACVWAL